MHKIKFKYKNTTHEAIARKFTGKRDLWYLINLNDGANFVITPREAQTVNDKSFWLQKNIPGEMVHPKDFIQAVGSGLEAAGIV